MKTLQALRHHRKHSWLADLQFAVGVMVAIGGAGVLLVQLIQALS